jgi:sterol desaturase/sphingolipid hydroxylase (fatty acid hydroxylase superfamily)
MLLPVHFDKIKNKGQARLFEKPWMESLTKTHPVVIYSMYLPVIAAMLYYGHSYLQLSVLAEVGWFVGGILFWSFFEYLMHRYLFHMMVHSKRAERFVYTMHGVHHEYPRDTDRLFMPPVPSILISTVLFFLFKLVTGAAVFAFFPGFIMGYLAYGSMHYAIHAFAPPKFLKALWRNHHLHHYKEPQKGFGVSSVLWDHVFGTMTKKDVSKAA